jgi:glycolate oxidase iron-sulfur subunit
LVEERHERGTLERWRRRAIEWVFPHPGRLRALLTPVRLAQRIGIWPLIAKRMPIAALIPPLGQTGSLPGLFPATGPERKRVGLLTGCVGQVLFDETNHATARVLARNGCTVLIPAGQSCCGALSLHSGAREAALDYARQTIAVFPEDLDAIVVNAAGCGAMLKQYGELLRDDPTFADRARRFSAKVRDVTEWLATLPVEAPPPVASVSVAYHDACHLAHAQQVREQPRELLRAIRGLKLVELPESEHCCGSAGSYNLTEPGMAARLQDRKVDNIECAKADCVAAANPGCILQIRAGLQKRGLRLPVLHPVDILDRAYRGESLTG